jgi:xylulokinase
MKAAAFPFGRVAAVSGSGQQHGSVYWRRGAEARLKQLRADAPLAEQLAEAFSVRLPAEHTPVSG